MEFVLLVLAFVFWNNACDGRREVEINLPGEPLTPQDFQNAQIFPQIDNTGNPNAPECELYRTDFQHHQRAKDQPTFQVWEGGYIPYMIDVKFDWAARAAIAGAMAQLRRATCINFITKIFHKDFVFIVKRPGPCGSYVGRLGGEQLVTLNEDCMTEGSVLHELLHVVGFEHEQCRMDRDNFIRVSFYNVSESRKHNFFKIPPPRANYAGPYDLMSITHYSAYAFPKATGLQTIFPNDKTKDGEIGQRKQLSELDKIKIYSFYNCTSVASQKPMGFIPIQSTKVNLHPNCKKFAELGACRNLTTSSWLALNCALSCPPAANSSNDFSCTNYNDNCERWAINGECANLQNEDYMSNYCAKSCNLCANQTHSGTTPY